MKTEITKLKLIAEARKNVSAIAKETKSLNKNDYYRVCFIETTSGELKIVKMQANWKTENQCIYFWNEPMTKKQVIGWLDEIELLEKQGII
jgi:hypothetical protein